ncbi:MFS transporter [Sphingobium arseniciresistens]|uniref:MFS transporter n=1 Tax=Sphingobium arseniciresistens TaxID=3030834 RepID=UPI0023B8D7AF
MILLAALALLQPGIDPVFLTLLSSANGVDPVDHGWIVGAAQIGMALGSLCVWLAGSRLPRHALTLAAVSALAASLVTARLGGLGALVLVRGGFGLAMGMIYTHAVSSAAARRPSGAYGAVFLVQLLLSTAAALLLPLVAAASGPALALCALAVVPLAATGMTLLPGNAAVDRAAESYGRDLSDRPVASVTTPPATPPAAWALAIATFCFVATSMMVWSFAGAMATHAGIDEGSIGWAVAVGSVAGAITALAVMREETLVPLPVTGILCGLCLLSPVLLTPGGDENLFTLSVILLNIGSTAIIIRCSGLASAASDDPLFRRFVACTHGLGGIAGPLIGSLVSLAMGMEHLGGGAMVMMAGGCLALFYAAAKDREGALLPAMREEPERRSEVAA